tara:strand:- start:3724 stop:3963 length:240 start_codon:yes stop_codon:yes gene_type:complete
MTTPFEIGTALAAAMMMAASPVTGPCEGRVVTLCSGDGSYHKIMIWDREAPLPGPEVGKACHACAFDKKRMGRKGRART